MHNLQSLSYSVGECKYHVIWIPKHHKTEDKRIEH
jgi:REP element-mobilizing transposase RayT